MREKILQTISPLSAVGGAGDGVDEVGPDLNFGLDDTGAAADKNPPDVGRYEIYYNIAVDEPIANVKTIRIIVLWEDRGAQKNATVDFMKADII